MDFQYDEGYIFMQLRIENNLERHIRQCHGP